MAIGRSLWWWEALARAWIRPDVASRYCDHMRLLPRGSQLTAGLTAAGRGLYGGPVPGGDLFAGRIGSV